MRVHRSNPRQPDDESLLAEARDLVRDRAILCELCRRRMRYFPASDEEAVRGFGRALAGNYFAFFCRLGNRGLRFSMNAVAPSIMSGEPMACTSMPRPLR